MSKTTVLHRDVAPGAEENAQMSATLHSADSHIDLLPVGTEPEPVATLEPNHWRMNGKFVLRETQTLAFWSDAMSDAEGFFAAPPTITATFSEQFSSVGITIVFDRASGGYCSEINVKWYQGTTLKADADFYPNSTTYFCMKSVEAWDKIVITLSKTSRPKRYAKIERILFGVHREFGMSELRNASIVNQMDGIAESLPVSTFRWTLDSRDYVDFMFQLKQPVEIFNDGNLLGVYYISKHTRKSERIYDIECQDAIGVLDETTFAGGVYSGKSAKALLAEIISSDFEIEYADDVVDTALTGILIAGSKRSAVQQVLFAWGTCMATDGSSALRVFNLDATLTEIPKGQTFPGVSVETDSIVTEVRVTAHSYVQDANGSIEVGGVRYSDTQTVHTITNPDVIANDKQKIKEFKNATLVSSGNVQSVAQRVYDWYQRRSTSRASIVWKGEALGDFVSFPNGWDGTNPGSITKMEIKLSNTVVAKCEATGA